MTPQISATCVCVLLALGCADDLPVDDTLLAQAEEVPRHAGSSGSSSGADAPAGIVDNAGNVWIRWVKQPDDPTQEIDWASEGLPPVPWSALPTEQEVASGALSANMKAELHRPMVLMHDHWYVRESASFDDVAVPGIKPGFEGEDNSELVPKVLVGGDNRVKANEELYPTSAILSVGFSGGIPAPQFPIQSYFSSNCTASLIGPSTALTAGHCLNTANNAYVLKPDATESTNPYPYGIVRGCFFLSRPTGYAVAVNLGWDPGPWDYGVVETRQHPTLGNVQPLAGENPCYYRNLAGPNPGYAVGYFGTYTGVPEPTLTALGNNAACVFGYPGDLQPNVTWPELWGTCAAASITGVMAVHLADTAGGQSGAGLWYYSSPNFQNPLLYATHIGPLPPFNLVNRGRLLDLDYNNFILANGQW